MLPPSNLHDELVQDDSDDELNSDVDEDEMATLIRSDSLSKSVDDDNVSTMIISQDNANLNSVPARPPDRLQFPVRTVSERVGSFREHLDEEIRSVPPSRSGRFAVHYLHQCHDHRAGSEELGVAHHPGRSSCTLYPHYSKLISADQLDSYFSLFVVYTPYTIYRCK